MLQIGFLVILLVDSSGSASPVPSDQPGPLSRSVKLRVSRTCNLQHTHSRVPVNARVVFSLYGVGFFISRPYPISSKMHASHFMFYLYVVLTLCFCHVFYLRSIKVMEVLSNFRTLHEIRSIQIYRRPARTFIHFLLNRVLAEIL